MASSVRGLRLLKTIELVRKTRPDYFDNLALNKVQLTSISDGSIKGWFIVERNMCNLGNIMHGGFMASVFDTMTYYAQLSNIDGRISLTTSMTITYIAPAKVGEKVTVETKCLKSGKTPVMESYLHNQQGTLIAKGLNSYVAAPEKYNTIMKDIMKFDVYEN